MIKAIFRLTALFSVFSLLCTTLFLSGCKAENRIASLIKDMGIASNEEFKELYANYYSKPKEAADIVYKAKKLGEEIQPKRNNAIDELVNIGEPAVGQLIKVLTDKDAGIRIGAAKALGKIKDPKSVTGLLKALEKCDSGNIYLRATIEEALANIGEPASKKLVGELKQKNTKIHLGAARRIMREPYTRTAYSDMSLLPDILIGNSSANFVDYQKVGQFLVPAVKVLNGYIEDENREVRYWAVVCLGEIGNELSSLPLCEAYIAEHKAYKQKLEEAQNESKGIPADIIVKRQDFFFDELKEAIVKVNDLSAVEPLFQYLEETDGRDASEWINDESKIFRDAASRWADKHGYYVVPGAKR